MKYPPTETLGFVTAPDGNRYTLHFYGENEGAAVITGPSPESGRLAEVPEVHREPALSAADARAKLTAWCRAAGWT